MPTAGILARAEVGGFDPRSLPGLEAWYDAQYPSGFGVATPSDATQISQWRDLGPNGAHLVQGTGSAQPLWRAANWNQLGNTAGKNMALSPSDGIAFGGTVSSSSIIASPTAPTYFNMPCVQYTAGSSVSGPYVANFIPVSPNATYTATSAMRGVAGRTFATGIYFYDSAKSIINNGSATPVAMNASTGAWVQSSFTRVAPSNAAFARVTSYTSSAVVNDVMQATGFGLGAGTVPPNGYMPPGNVMGVQFDGLNDAMGSSYTFAKGACPVSAYVVANVFGQNSIAGTQQLLICYSANLNRFYVAANATGLSIGLVGTSNLSAATSFGSSHVSSLVSGSQSPLFAYRADTGTNATTNSASATPGLNNVLQLGYSAQYPNALISSALVFSSQHDAATRRRVENWLAARYSINLARP